MDSRRLLAARQAGVNVQANVRVFDDPLTLDESVRFTRCGFDPPNAWGEAARARIMDQVNHGGDASWPGDFPNGSI